MAKYKYNKNYFNKIDSSEKAYWLGFLYADGSITRFYKEDREIRSMSLELTLQEGDKSHLSKFLNALESNVPIQNRTIAKKYKACRIVINCTQLCNDLIRLGCTPAKSLTLTFPNSDIVPNQYINHFIRGYFDGDGGISYTKKPYYYKDKNKTYPQYHLSCYFSGNSYFIPVLKNILDYEGIVTSTVYKDKRSNSHDIYMYGLNNIMKFMNYIYSGSTISLSRKLDKFFYVKNELIPQ